jgi:peptidoglycan/xylan/chitin deacetylase (PgdA/CDA1 family)
MSVILSYNTRPGHLTRNRRRPAFNLLVVFLPGLLHQCPRVTRKNLVLRRNALASLAAVVLCGAGSTVRAAESDTDDRMVALTFDDGPILN